MSSTNRKELVFILVTTLAASLCFFSIYSGTGFSAITVDPHTLTVVPHNCYQADTTNNKGPVFYKGYVYAGGNVYHGWKNIAMEPTSPQWHVPVVYENTRLELQAQEEGYSLRFFCEHQTARQTLPVVLLVADPADFFDQQNGIYVEGNARQLGTAEKFSVRPWTVPANYFERGKDQQRPAFMVYYNEKGDLLTSAPVKAQVSGNATRSFPQKSIRLDAVKKKGSKTFELPFFSDGILYSSVVLRNGGNDWTKTLISDGVMQTALQSQGIDVLGFKPCNVYLNGMYWGIHSLRNRSDEDYIAEKYGVKRKQVTFMENWSFQKGKKKEFKELMKVVNACKKNGDEKLAAKLAAVIDMDALALYLAAQIYYVNTDWPANNIKAYKTPGGKWRFILFDLDYGMGYTGSDAVKKDMFAYLLKQNNPMGRMFKVLLKEKTFRKKLKDTFAVLMAGPLSPASLEKRVRDYSRLLAPCMAAHIQRWRKPVSVEQWQQGVNNLVAFSRQRAGFLQKHITQHLSAP